MNIPKWLLRAWIAYNLAILAFEVYFIWGDARFGAW